MVRTPSFHCRGPGFNPGGETKIPQARVAKNRNTLLLKKGAVTVI